MFQFTVTIALIGRGCSRYSIVAGGARRSRRTRIDAIVRTAGRAMPELALNALSLEKDGIRVDGRAAALLVRDHANFVQFDGASGTAVATGLGEDLSIHQRLSEAADSLHFGNWGGLASRLIWFAFGLVLTMLAASGALIDPLRLTREMRWSVPTGLWRGMGVLAVPCALLVAAALVLLGANLQ